MGFDDDLDFDANRRSMLQYLGAAGVAGMAGCITGGDDDGAGTPTDDSGDPTPTETETPADVDQITAGGEFIGTFGADVKNYDPVKINDTTSSMGTALVYESLLATDFSGTTQPNLAESLEQTGDLTFRATLRQGVTFHNGDELTAEDVQASLDRYEGTPRESDVFLWYDSSEIVDDYTIDINLSGPYAPFRYSIAAVPIVPAAAENGDLDLAEEPVGTGPYVFDEHQEDDLWRLQRNDDYWFDGSDSVPEEPPIETLTFRVVVEQSAQVAALESGDVDFISGPPAESISDLKEDDQFTVSERIAGGFDMFIYPTQIEPFTSAKVRRGVGRLIPREAIVESVYDGIGVPAYAPISPLAEEYSPEEFQQDLADEYARYNTEKAQSLLEEGFSDAGVEPPFETTIVTNENPQRVKWAQLIQESLNNTEYFEVGLEQYEWNTYTGKVLAEDSHEQNMLVALGWSAGWDPDNYVNYLFSSETFTPACCNVNHYENERVDELISQGLETFDVDERKEIYRDLQELLVEESPMSFIRFGKEMDAFRTDTVKGWQTYPINSGQYNAIYAPYSDQVTWVEK